MIFMFFKRVFMLFWQLLQRQGLDRENTKKEKKEGQTQGQKNEKKGPGRTAITPRKYSAEPTSLQ